MAVHSFTWRNLGVRLVASLLLVFLTYNPAGFSYYHWVTEHPPFVDAAKVFVGLLILAGWVVLLRATLRSLGPLGIVLAAALFGTAVWLFADWGLVRTDSDRAVVYIAEVILSLILATGVSWSHVRRRLSGQVDTDDVEEER